MGRYRGPRLSIIRRLGALPAFSKKRPKVRPKRLPLGHPVRKRKRRLSIYGMRLLAKQRCCFSYGLRDYQLKSYVQKAHNTQGDPIKSLLYFLESRIDSRIYRSGIAKTMPAARQLVTHGHVKVDGNKIISPSYSCKSLQTITYKGKELPSRIKKKSKSYRRKNKKDQRKIYFSPIQVLEYYATR